MRKFLPISFIFLSTSLMAQQGSISLTTPITFTAPPTISTYNPVSLLIQVVPTSKIVVVISSNTTTQQLAFTYPDDCQVVGATCSGFDTDSEVLTLINQLNNINLSTRSLWRRVFDRLVADFPSRFPGGATVQ